MKLSPELARWREVIEGHAKTMGLDFFETVFEVLDYGEMNEVASFGGFPTRYPHWRFGMEYERMSKSFRYGLHRIYELVINNDPCYAYLLASNPVVDQKLVMAHVYGHCDFFKNNYYFSFTNRKMIDEMANHATKVRRFIDTIGLDKVEEFLDLGLSLENLIDHMSPYVRRISPPEKLPAKDVDEPLTPKKLRSKDYMETFINPPAYLEKQKQKLERAKQKKESATPEPIRDVLTFLIEHAPLKQWQAEILEIVRNEAYYFNPQAMTKIMNEGWATYWHRRIMTKKVLTDSEVIDYAETMSGTLQSAGTSLNPYQLGLALWEDLEERWNTGRHGLEFDRCDDVETKRRWNTGAMAGRDKVFEVRRLHCDVTFIDEFLTEDFCHREKLFLYGWNPRTQRKELLSRDFKQVKAQLLRQLTNGGHPVIDVVDSNHRNRGELVLEHKWAQSDLRDDYAKATLENIRRIWTRPVRLLTRQGEKSVAYVADAEGVRLEDN